MNFCIGKPMGYRSDGYAIQPDMKILRILGLCLMALLLAAPLVPSAQAYPYGYCGWGGYRGGWGGWGGWYGTGIPNGLGWTMFGLGAAATVAAPVVAATYAAPVYPAPVYAAPYYAPAPPPPQQVVVEKTKVVEEQAPATPPSGPLAKAQAKLAGLGYYHGPVDGNYGPSTAQAVQQFQADNNLPVSGRLDLKTLAILGITLQ
jgi:hypothetical protein